MSMRWKKLIGTFVILLWMTVWALAMMRLAVDILPEAHWAVELAYYAIAGMAWIIPLKPLLRWMQTPGAADRVHPA